jgi:phospholipid/cholesterol/gamma-HCH transport system permease protein
VSALVDTLVKRPLNSLDRLGEQLAFYIKALAWSGRSVTAGRSSGCSPR